MLRISPSSDLKLSAEFMLLCRRLSSITGRAFRIHHRTFFSQRVLKQAEFTTPGDGGISFLQALDDANEDTPDTHPEGTHEPQKTPQCASTAAAALIYEKRRQSDPQVALNLVFDPYVQNLRDAMRRNDYYRVRTLIGQIIRDDQEDKTIIANKIQFTILSVPLKLIPPMMVVSMLRLVSPFLGEEKLSRKVIDRIIALILDSSPNASQKLVDLIFPSFLLHLKNAKPQETWSGIPFPLVRSSLALLRWLLPRSQERSAELFKILVDLGHIPPSALQGDDKSGNIYSLMYAPSIKTCGQRGWTELACEFLNDYLKSPDAPQALGTDLAMELVGHLLDTPSENDLYRCCNLIERLHTYHPMPDEIIRDFYAIANQYNFGRPAERLYLFTRDMRRDKIKPHNYPLPQGRSLVWLARDLARDDSTRPHFEFLVKEAHEQQQDVSIPAPHQPHYLILVVVEGFGLIAQSLWEKWTQGVSGEVISGSPEIMVRVIRLTRSLTRKQGERLTFLKNCNPRNDTEIMESKRKLDEISYFANRVLRAYIAKHEPLGEADHLTLTSLARAHFVLGNVSDGFHCFRILLRRMDKPDIVDINVGLTALAEYEPRAASAFLTVMLKYDVEPDETTFSTILHHSMMKDDLNLCTELALLMKKTLGPGSNFLPFYSMASASVIVRSGDSKQRRVARLKTVLGVLRMMDYPVDKFVMYPEVGKSLILASLHYPELAFEFWEVVYKGVPRNDLEYCNQVGDIRMAIRKAWNRGNLDRTKMRDMLSKLLRN